MNVTILVPTGVIVQEDASRISVETTGGRRSILPRHVDIAAVVVPGIVTVHRESGTEEIVAVDEGALVKQGASVRISVRNASRGSELGQLHRTIEQEYKNHDENERETRSALARLEATLARGIYEFEQ